MVEQLNEFPQGKMIDLAGGEGRNALWFAKRGFEVENVEISKVALEKFELRAKREQVLDRCHSTHGSALDAKFSLNADLLVVAYLQIPIDQLLVALDNAVSQLNDGAMVFGIWHAKRNLTEGFGGPQDPDALPAPEQLLDWASNNLQEVDVFEVERTVEADGVTRTAIDVILRGRVDKAKAA